MYAELILGLLVIIPVLTCWPERSACRTSSGCSTAAPSNLTNCLRFTMGRPF